MKDLPKCCIIILHLHNYLEKSAVHQIKLGTCYGVLLSRKWALTSYSERVVRLQLNALATYSLILRLQKESVKATVDGTPLARYLGPKGCLIIPATVFMKRY